MTLLVLTFAAIAFLLFLILVVELHAFLALVLTSMGLGLATGMPPAAVLKSIQNGFGEALGFIAIVLGLGAMIGGYLEHSGGGRALAEQPKGRLLYSPWNFVHARTPFLGVFIGRVNRINAFRGVYLPPRLHRVLAPFG